METMRLHTGLFPVRIVGPESFGVDLAGFGEGVPGAARLDFAVRVVRHVFGATLRRPRPMDCLGS